MTTTTAITIWVRSEGRMFKMPARQSAKLIRELQAGRGQAELMSLLESGYDEFLGADGECYCIDGMTLELLGVQA
jgi:hypothetical protein